MNDKRMMVLGAYFTGAEPVAWRHPEMCDLLDVNSFVENARIAEEALLHVHFMAEGLHLRETPEGQVSWHTNTGRHDVVTMHAAVGAMTSKIGLISTINSTFNEPYDLARKLATFDVFSHGRTAWNLVTAQPPLTVANYAHRPHAKYPERYTTAEAFLSKFWKYWRSDGSLVPAPSWDGTPQKNGPLMFTASMSPAGADFAAAIADGAFILPRSVDHARQLYAQTKDRLKNFGRSGDELKVIAGRDIVVGDTEEEAHEKFSYYMDLELTDFYIIRELEKIWMRDLSDVDPDGPLPRIAPDRDRVAAFIKAEPGQTMRDPDEYIAHWLNIAETSSSSCREFIKDKLSTGGTETRAGSARGVFIGTAESVSDQMEHWFTTGAADGFIIQPHVVPLGLREFTAQVVPVLQERGLFRAQHEGGDLTETWRLMS